MAPEASPPPVEPEPPVAEPEATTPVEPESLSVEAEATPSWMSSLRRAARPARRVYLAALGVAIVWLAATRRSEVADMLRDARPVPLAAAFVATFLLIWLLARVWAVSLRLLGHPVTDGEVALATARALPARYVPLGVSFAVGRIALLRAAGVPLAPLSITAALEMVIHVAVALTLGLALLAASGGLTAGLTAVAAVAAVAAAAASPAIAGRIISRLATRRGVALAVTWKGYARLAAADALYWIWASATFVLYLRAFPAGDDFGIVHTAGAFMVAWAVGFMTVLAPQGLGVAEVSLVALLASAGDTGVALALVFGGYRLVQLARDMLAAAVAEVIATRRARRE